MALKGDTKVSFDEGPTTSDYRLAFDRLVSYAYRGRDAAVTRRECATYSSPRRAFESGQAEAFAEFGIRLIEEIERLRHSDYAQYAEDSE